MYVKCVLKVGLALSGMVILVAGQTTSPTEPPDTLPTPCQQNADPLDYNIDDFAPCEPSVPKATSGWPWLPMLLPFLVGLGVLEAVFFHTAIFYIIGTVKTQPEQWRRWRLTAAGAMGVAWSVQTALFAGLVAVALRMRDMVRDGSFASATAFSAFDPKLDEYPLQPIIWATPVAIACYWLLLSILCRREEKMKRRKEQMDMLVKGTTDIQESLPITKI